MRREDLDPKNTKIELSIRAIAHLIYSFEADYGKDELNKFMESTGLPAAYFYNEHNWVSYEYFLKLLDRLVEYTGNPRITYKYGLNVVKYAHAAGILKTIMSIIPSPLYVYKSLQLMETTISKVGKYNVKILAKNKIQLEAQPLDEKYKQNKYNCLNMEGIFAALPSYFGLPFAEVKQLQCAAEGAKSCVFEITWQGKRLLTKNHLFSLLIGTAAALIIFTIIKWQLASPPFLAKTALILLPFALFAIGRFFDYKRTIKDNSEVENEQNNSVIESIKNAQRINEELQVTVDQRTQELKISNERLNETIREVKKMQEKLLQAERMIGMGQLAAGVAHEINNPMGAVRNYLQDILEDFPKDDGRNEDLTEAEIATGESKILINDLLSFSRTDNNLYIININVNDIIENIIAQRRKDFSNKNIKINKAFAPHLPYVKSDAMQINQVFSNIIINAYNAIGKNPEFSIKTSSNNKGVCVKIKDNGEIIPEHIINIIFDPLKKEYEGIGRKDLGLAISYNIVSRYNGEMTVSSSIENGTIFDVLIPYNSGA